MINQPGPALTNCPRCQAPLQPGQQKCNICGLALDPASLQEFYRYQQQTMGTTTPQIQAQQRLANSVQRSIAGGVIAITILICSCFIIALAVFSNIH